VPQGGCVSEKKTKRRKDRRGKEILGWKYMSRIAQKLSKIFQKCFMCEIETS